MFWSDGCELVCITTDESFFILKFDSEAIEKSKENPESVTEDGIDDAFDVSKHCMCVCVCVCVCVCYFTGN